jgi:glycine/serine hydroxymethyltransferase
MAVNLTKDAHTVRSIDARACRIIVPEHGAVLVTNVAPFTPGRVILAYVTPAGIPTAHIVSTYAAFQRAYSTLGV